MNSFNYQVFNEQGSLPMPLTNVDHSGYSWCKFGHIDYLLNPRISALSLAEQGALTRLMAQAARQVPYASLPNESAFLAAVVGLSEKRWNKIADHVLSAAFTLCADKRLYCSLMVDQLSTTPATNSDTGTQPARKTKRPVDPELSAKRSEAAKQAHANRAKQSANDDAESLQNPAKHANGSANDANLHDANLQNSANLHANEGGKGGEKDLDSELDLDKDSKKQTHTPNQANAELMQNAEIVFLFWKKTFSKGVKTLFDGKRKTNVIARLKDGYSAQDLKTAITGCSKSDHHVKGHYTDLELICRDAVHTDRFIALAGSATSGSVNAQYQEQINNAVPVKQEDLENDPDWIAYQQMNGGSHANNQ